MGRKKIYFSDEEIKEAHRKNAIKSYYRNKNKNKKKDELNLSICQEKAKNEIINFIENKNAKNFSLTGNAGTGKSFLVCVLLIDYFLSKFDRIYFLAPTNKAIDVLKEKVNREYKELRLKPTEDEIYENENKDEKTLGKLRIEFKTTAQFFNKKQRYDLENRGKELGYAPYGYNIYKYEKKNYYYKEYKKIVKTIIKNGKEIKKTEYIKIEKKDINPENLKKDAFFYCRKEDENSDFEKNLFIIDECSLIDDLEITFFNCVCNNIKKIFLGDILQLPPVDETKGKGDFVSKIFTMDYPTINMTTIKRTSDKDIAYLYEKTRDIVENSIKKKYKIGYDVMQDNPIIAKNKLISCELEEKIKDDLENNLEFVILSNTNNAVKEYNNFIIDCLENNKKKEFGFFYNTKYLMKEYYNGKLKNNVIFSITDMYKTKMKFDEEENEIKVIILKTDIQKFTGGYEEIIIIENINDKNLLLEWYNKNKKKILENFDKISKNPKEEKERKRLVKYFYFKDTYIKEKYEELEGAIAYLEKIKRLFIPRDVDFFHLNYGITINKAQGSSYEKVYINFGDIYRNNRTTMTNKAKLLYVATTRAVKEAYYF